MTSLTTRVWAATAAAVIGLAPSACGNKGASSSTNRAPRITTSEWTPRPATTTTAPAATSEADAVRVWYASAGTHIRGLSVANKQINDAANVNDYTALVAGCERLQEAVNGLGPIMPTPNAELTTEVQGVIDDYGAAARGCIASVPAHDEGAMGQAAQLMGSGGRHLDAATVIIGRIINGG